MVLGQAFKRACAGSEGPGLYAFKVVLMGDGAVGKSTLRQKFMGETFNATYVMTIGADFAVKHMRVGDVDVKFVIWDLAGQPHFRAVRTEFYRGARGALLVYDITRRATFENVPAWMKEFIRHTKGEGVAVVLVGNKVDLREKGLEQVSQADGLEMARELREKHGIPVSFIETSALTGENVDKAFFTLADEILKKVRGQLLI